MRDAATPDRQADAAVERKPETSNDSIANVRLADAGMIMPTEAGARPAELADGVRPTASTQTDLVQREKRLHREIKISNWI